MPHPTGAPAKRPVLGRLGREKRPRFVGNGSRALGPGSRFAQADREALITLGLYFGYFIWWYAFAYGLGGGDPGAYKYVWGFPAWFFYSCLAGYPLLTLALWLVVRLFFRDMPLDAYRDAPDADAAPPPSSGASSDSL